MSDIVEEKEPSPPKTMESKTTFQANLQLLKSNCVNQNNSFQKSNSKLPPLKEYTGKHTIALANSD